MMKMRHILYISLVLLIAGCTNEDNFSDTLSGKGKTPLTINATINTGRAHTRASGNNFVEGDEILTYIRHITSGDAINNYTYVSAGPDGYNKLITYTKGSAAMGDEDANKVRETSDLTSAAYWDDFSTSTHDLRDDGHGLQSYYGYCYNGGTPTSIDAATGVLAWTVLLDQSTANAVNVRHSDLLWSPTQEKVAYSHQSAHDANHGTLTIPYTHAMSQITVTVIADEGFEGSTDGSKKPLNNTILELHGMNIETTLTATTTTFRPLKKESAENIITMFPEAYNNAGLTNNFLNRNFTAIVAPGTKLEVDAVLLRIYDADGNNYEVKITNDMLSTASGKWGNGLSGTDQIGSSGEYIVTQPGVNYHLDVTIKKSAVQAKSTLADWSEVNATANGEIYFGEEDIEYFLDDSYPGSSSPVDVDAIDKNQFINGASFSLFRVQATNSNTDGLGTADETPKEYTTRTNDNYAFASISTFTNNDGDDDYWTNSPELYWPNNSDEFYYRALAQFNTPSNPEVNDITSVGALTPSIDKGTSVSQGTIAEGHDILWGTTPKHYGYMYHKIYKKDYPIPPRTHGVPIIFEHAMSKVSFTLETTDDAAAKVNLSEASFVVSGLYTSGTILIDNGEISNRGEAGGTTISANATVSPGTSTTLVSNLIVVPQTFDVSDKVTITLPNESNAVYSIPLANCTVSGGNTSSAWERGKNYSYTIHVEKEKVQLKVMVKDWEEVTGSSNAALEW